MLELSKYDTIFFDLDGVVYLGNTLIPGVDETISQLRKNHKIGFVTNNASRTCAEFADKLTLLNIPTSEHEVISTPGVLASAIKRELPQAKKILTIASSGVKDLLITEGYELVDTHRDKPDLVVNGLCKNLNWDDLAEVSYAIANGVTWWATNLDPVVPTDFGIAPGNGSIVSLLNVVTGKMPRDFGKPNKEIFLHALERFESKNPLFVGDTLTTDIAGANNVGMDAVLVFSGNTNRQMLKEQQENYQIVEAFEDVTGLLK